MKKRTITTSWGAPIDDTRNSVTVGQNGPIAIQDTVLLDKLAKFHRERIPERVVHAKGSGALGYFEVTNDLTKYCKAKFLEEIGKKTPVLLRFSTVGAEKGSADTERDPRGFAIKFYTEEGNWDMVGNNTPIFFIRDPLQFPDFIHTQKRNPQTNLKDASMYWDFFSLVPESSHQVTILFSDRGTPYGYRHMNGYGSHTFRWVNEQNEACWVKFHFKTKQGIKNFTGPEADDMKSKDMDFSQRDLFESIQRGDCPAWKFCVQIMPEEDAADYEWNIFDVTKVWPHKDYPLIEVGNLVLNRNPKNYHAEIEQSAFSPAHMVPGIEPSFDKMLQGRLYSYQDTHIYRLGANFDQIPVNCPYRTTVTNGYRDGFMNVNGNQGSDPNYHPNSKKPFHFSQRSKLSTLPVRGNLMRYKPNHPNCDFLQPGNLYRNVMNTQDQDNLISNIVGHLKNARKDIQERQVRVFYKCDPEYGNRVAQGLGLSAIRPKL